MSQYAHPVRSTQSIDVFRDASRPSDDLLRSLEPHFEVHQFGIEGIRSRRPGAATILDIDVSDSIRAAVLKSWLEGAPPGAKSMIVLTSNDYSQVARARTTGAGKVLSRPIEIPGLIEYFLDGHAPRTAGKAPAVEASVADGARSLDSIFHCVRSGIDVDKEAIREAGEQIVDQIGVSGLSDWITTVRKHHDQTFQHCLLVTGVGVAFARHLGFSAEDQSLISLAGMLHDLGKAKIPLAILNKPGPLDEHEWTIMREHPRLGAEALQGNSEVPGTVLEIVKHHHEHLDGTGYPHRLKGAEISDIVRMMTIADVFGALMERRSYKPPMSSEQAYGILVDMGPKLDRALLRAFHSVATGNHV